MTEPQTWKQLVQAARREATAARDWHMANAVERAQRYLGDPRVQRVYDEQQATLTIASPQSGAVYVANGTCQREDGTPCPAFADGRPCWHLAAKELLRRLLNGLPPSERDTLPVPASPPDSPPPLRVAVEPEAEEEPELIELCSGVTLQPRPIPLHIGGDVVAFAGDAAEATRWFARHEPHFLSLE